MIKIQKIRPKEFTKDIQTSVRNRFFKGKIKARLVRPTSCSIKITNIREINDNGYKNYLPYKQTKEIARKIKEHLDWFFSNAKFEVKI
jgi:hypothetical protein